jgi:hypothetical protein
MQKVKLEDAMLRLALANSFRMAARREKEILGKHLPWTRRCNILILSLRNMCMEHEGYTTFISASLGIVLCNALDVEDAK